MAESPFVSIIVPFRNEEAYLERCVESLLSIDFPADRYEIILAGDSSQDKSTIIADNLAAKSLGRIRLVVTQKVEGPGPAVNFGVKVSKGSVCARVDADAVVDNDYLKVAINRLADLSVGAVIPKIEPVGKTGQSILFGQDAPTLGHGFPIFRREVFELVGGYDSSFFQKAVLLGHTVHFYFREDTDLLLSMMEHGYKVVREPRAVARHDVYRVDFGLMARWGLNHMMDALLFKKHPSLAKRELGILIGPLTKWGVGFLVATFTLLSMAFLVISRRWDLMLLPISALCIEYLLVLKSYGRHASRRLLSPFAFYLFSAFAIAGRLYGSLKARKLII